MLHCTQFETAPKKKLKLPHLSDALVKTLSMQAECLHPDRLNTKLNANVVHAIAFERIGMRASCAS